MKNFRILLKMGSAEMAIFHNARCRGAAWDEMELLYPDATISSVILIKEETAQPQKEVAL